MIEDQVTAGLDGAQVLDIEHAALADVAGGDKDRRLPAMAIQQRQRFGEDVLIAVVKGDHHRLGREGGTLHQISNEIVEWNDCIAVTHDAI